MKEHQLAAIVFTDIVGYTRKMEADEQGTMELLARQREIIFPMVKEYGGEVIKEIGDGLMMMFHSANRAVRFAMAVQEKIKDDELTIRAGIHIGDVIFEEGDVFGSAVNIAARIEPLAQAGGICISEDVRSQIRNQGDIITRSIGKKELKGVNEEIEIFGVLTEKTLDPLQKKPFLIDLWQRRVFQITAIYLLISYMIKLLMATVVKEFMLSPLFEPLIWYILLSLTPSIILVSYFHGRRGISKWTRAELIGMPVNVLLAVIVMSFLFDGRDLVAHTTLVTVQDEHGKDLKVEVAKNEYRKSILIYFIENKTGDTTLDYLQYGIPDMTEYDLQQDIFITARTAMNIYQRLLEMGYENPIGLPTTLMKRFADQQHMNFYMFGELKHGNKGYLLHVKLYETSVNRLITEISLEGDNYFKLVDQLSVAIKKDLELPESHISQTEDHLIEELATNSEKALYYYSMSLKEGALNNWSKQVKLLEYAVIEDPDFAMAYVTLALAYLNLGNMEGSNNILQKSADLLYKLPQRQQFIHKYVSYVVGQEPEKALTVLRMWVELYPYDLGAHGALAQRYAVMNRFPEAIEEYKTLLELDPERYDFLRTIGYYYLQIGNLDSALVYFEKYLESDPQSADPYRTLGDFYRIRGDHTKARENFNNALALADISEQVPIKVNLASILEATGEFDLALEEYQEALRISRNKRDSINVLNALTDFYLVIGQVKRSVETYELLFEKLAFEMGPKDILVQRVITIQHYINAAMFEDALIILNEVKTKLEPPLDQLTSIGYMLVYAETGEIEKANEAINVGEDFMTRFGEEILRRYIYFAQARMAENMGNYEEAIKYYNKNLDLDPSAVSIHSWISRCYRILNDFVNAEEEIMISLKPRPFEPLRNYEAALLYIEMDEKEKAKEHLERVLNAWKDADPEYNKAMEARKKLEEMN